MNVDVEMNEMRIRNRLAGSLAPAFACAPHSIVHAIFCFERSSDDAGLPYVCKQPSLCSILVILIPRNAIVFSAPTPISFVFSRLPNLLEPTQQISRPKQQQQQQEEPNAQRQLNLNNKLVRERRKTREKTERQSSGGDD